MQKNYLSKLGILTSIFYNCSLPETNQQISDEKFISLKKDLKKLLSQNVLNNGHHQRQIHGMQNSIQDLKNDVSNLTQLLNSQKYVNDQLLQNIKTIKEQVDELKTLPDTVQNISTQATELGKSVNDIKDQVEKLKTLPDTVQNISTQATELGKFVNEIKGQVNKLEKLPDTVQGIQGQVDELKTLQTTVQNISTQATDLVNSVDKINKEVEKLKTLPDTVQGIKDQVGKLNDLSQETNLAKELNTIKGNIANLSTNFVNLFQQINK